MVSKVIALAAPGREDSGGDHFREGYPDTSELAHSTFIRVRLSGGALRLKMVPVDFSIERSGESLIEAKAGALRERLYKGLTAPSLARFGETDERSDELI